MTHTKKHLVSLLTGIAATLIVASAPAAPPLPGAIFTTDINGDLVNGNTQYQAQCDVYLDGGPGPNAPRQAAGLPDGNYYYQVTDPSGKKLLSTDAPENRCFTVSDGIITNQCAVNPAHGVGASNDHGGITIQLCPYDRTPNPGGVYKVWATPVDDFVGDPTDDGNNNCGNGCFHGFLPAASKTDNFKVGDASETYCVRAYKYGLDKKDSSYVPVEGYEIFFAGNVNYTNSDGMVEICGLIAGTYGIEEASDYEGIPTLVLFSSVNGDQVEPPSTGLTFSVGGRNDPDTAIVEWVNTVAAK